MSIEYLFRHTLSHEKSSHVAQRKWMEGAPCCSSGLHLRLQSPVCCAPSCFCLPALPPKTTDSVSPSSIILAPPVESRLARLDFGSDCRACRSSLACAATQHHKTCITVPARLCQPLDPPQGHYVDRYCYCAYSTISIRASRISSTVHLNHQQSLSC